MTRDTAKSASGDKLLRFEAVYRLWIDCKMDTFENELNSTKKNTHSIYFISPLTSSLVLFVQGSAGMLTNSLDTVSSLRGSASPTNAKASKVSVIFETEFWLWTFIYRALSLQTSKTLTTSPVLVLTGTPLLVSGLSKPLARQH